MGEIVPIRQGITPEPPAGTISEDVVKEVTELLDKAKSGEVIGLAYVALYTGDLTNYCSAGRITRKVIGTVSVLQYSLAKGDTEVE